MVRKLKRLVRRLLVLGSAIVAVWLIVFVFRITDHRLPSILAVSHRLRQSPPTSSCRASCGSAVKILQRKVCRAYTLTSDGLPGDPVNLVLSGDVGRSLTPLLPRPAGPQADRLSLKSSWRMVRRVRAELALPDSALQHTLSLRPRPGRRFPEGDRRQPAQTPSHSFLGLQPATGADRARNGKLLAEHRPAAGSCRGFLDRSRHQRHRLLAHAAHIPDHPRHRFRHQHGAGLYCCRAQQNGCHWRSYSLSAAPEAPRRTCQSLCDRWTNHGCHIDGGRLIRDRPSCQLRAVL